MEDDTLNSRSRNDSGALTILEKLRDSWDEQPDIRDLEQASAIGMRLAELALTASPSDSVRTALWNTYFGPLYNLRDNYQFQDFEIADYKLYSLDIRGRLYRGPPPATADLMKGNYICMIGAAQFFGRFQQMGLHELISNHYRIPVLNLAAGGVGPEEYLSSEYLPFLQNARLVIVQVLSGRSVGCDEFPGDWKTSFRGQMVAREVLLRTLIREGNLDEYRRLVRKWETIYRELYAKLAEAIPGPKLLVWISARQPGAWNHDIGVETGRFGKFPQLVTEGTVGHIRRYFDDYAESVTPDSEPVRVRSRFTGEPCPFVLDTGQLKWETAYYPAASAYSDTFNLIEDKIRKLLNQG